MGFLQWSSSDSAGRHSKTTTIHKLMGPQIILEPQVHHRKFMFGTWILFFSHPPQKKVNNNPFTTINGILSRIFPKSIVFWVCSTIPSTLTAPGHLWWTGDRPKAGVWSDWNWPQGDERNTYQYWYYILFLNLYCHDGDDITILYNIYIYIYIYLHMWMFT